MTGSEDVKNYKSKGGQFLSFYICCFLFLLILTFGMFDILYKVSEPSVISTNIDDISVTDNQLNHSLVQIKKEIDSVREVFTLMSFTSVFFGILITAISIFFALRESSRVDNIILSYESKIEKYEQIESKLNSLYQTGIEKLSELNKELDSIKKPNEKGSFPTIQGRSNNRNNHSNQNLDKNKVFAKDKGIKN